MIILRILVVITGGTMGSSVKEGEIHAHERNINMLFKMYEEVYGKDVSFEILKPFYILSENLSLTHWETLYKAVNSRDCSNYDGIIVTHGSDTITYTSAMCSYLFSHLNIPFVLTASNYPLGDERSNGLNNFHCAVVLIRSALLKGVFAVFQNDKEENIVYLGGRMEEADGYLDQYRCFGGEPFARIRNGEIVFHEHKINPSLEDIRKTRESVLGNNIELKNKVLILHPYPGFCYDDITFSQDIKAVVLCLYHSATACVEGERYSAASFIRECKREGIEVYLNSFRSIHADFYITTNELLKAGGIPLLNLSKEAAYTKLLLAYNQKKMEPKAFVEKNIFFEVLPENQ